MPGRARKDIKMKKLIALLLTLTLVIGILASCTDKNDDPLGAVNLTALASHDDVIALMLKGDVDVAVLPEPKATAAINQAKAQGINYTVKLNISEEWSKVTETALAMGCLAVRTDFAYDNRTDLNAFLEDYKKSINFIGNPENKEQAAALIVSAGIIPKAPIAKSALDNLYGSIVYQDGAEMKATLEGFYDAIGQAKPDERLFYYSTYSVSSVPNEPATTDKVIKIGVMNGPTGMGMAKLIDDYKDNEKYEFIAYTDPALANADLTKGNIDMACIPTNAAATLSTKGAPVMAAAINCLGSLYVVAKEGVEINSISDLIGKNVYYGVPSSTTEPILNHIFAKNNIIVSKDDGN